MRLSGWLSLLACVLMVGACEGPRGKPGQPGADGTTGDPGDPGADGENGEAGTSCTVEDNGDGSKTISCEDGTTVDIADGAAGGSCTVEDNGDGSKTISCEDGTTVDVNDGASCTVVDNGDGTKTLTCEDGTSVDIVDGAVGADGQSGRNASITDAGVNATIEGITIAGGVATVTFTLTDTAGHPLDTAGVYTVGPVSMRFLLGWLDETGGVAGQYTSYIVNADGLASAERPSSESGGGAAPPKGTLTLLDWAAGRYEYEFATAVTVDAANTGKTHTVGITASHTVDGVAQHDNVLYNFRPDGAAVAVTREIVTTAACNTCHDSLGLHGGRRKEVGVCIMCHTPQSDSAGEVVDLKVMVHKIHMGEQLPSVEAGGTYGIGNADWSEVAFPQDIRNCGKCHDGAADGARYETYSRTVCGSCHDTTSFVDPAPAGMVLHTGGAQPDDSQCTICHRAGGFAASIDEAHVSQFRDPVTDDVQVEIIGVTNTAPTQQAVVTFKVRVNGAYRNIIALPMDRLSVTMAGPTTDPTWSVSGTIQRFNGTPNGTLANPSGDNETFTYTFQASAAVPANALGSAILGFEAQTAVYDASNVLLYASPARNAVTTVAITDAQPVPRRTIVEQSRCENCHERFYTFHGGRRTEVAYCPACHTQTRMAGTQRFETTAAGAPFSVERQSLMFKDMIHGIHRGEERESPLTLYSGVNAANPGGTSQTPFTTLYPGILSDCTQCHVEGGYSIDDTSARLPTQYPVYTCSEVAATDVDNYCTDPNWTSVMAYRQPITAACTTCHDSEGARAHAQLNTTATGEEACAVCHGSGAEFEAHP